MHHLRSSDYRIARSYLSDKKFFAHVRSDKIETALLHGNIILENSVLIHYNKYKKKTKLGNVFANKNEVILHQISNKNFGNGNAVSVINRFFDYVNTTVYLCVRNDNPRAIRFYEKVGMKCVGKIFWGKDKNIEGKVFMKYTGNTLSSFLE